MQISEAMRKGAKMGPQLFNKQRDGRGGSCAYGAVVLGLGGALFSHFGFEGVSEEAAAILLQCGFITAACPYDGCSKPYTSGASVMPFRPIELNGVIVHLNNDHRWSREAIATWIELTFENPLPDRKITAGEVMAFIGEPLQEVAVR